MPWRLAPRQMKMQRHLSSDSRRVNREPLIIKSTHTDAKENIVRSFVSHSVQIISFPAQMTNNLIKYHSHADRKRPSASPPGVFVCVSFPSLRARRARQSHVTYKGE